MKPDTSESDSQLDLKRRARRRLVGAVFFVVVVAAVLPMVMDNTPPPQLNDFRIITEAEKQAAAAPVVVPPPEAVPASAAPAAPGVIKEVTTDAKPAEAVNPSTPPVAVTPAQVDAKPVVIADAADVKTAAAKPVEKSAEKPAEKPVEKKAVEKPADKPLDKKPAEAKKDAKDAKEPVQAGQYYIQVGVFADADNVKQVRSKLNGQGISSWTEAATGNLAGKTRVKAGPFPSKEAADKALGKITKAGLNGLVVKK